MPRSVAVGLPEPGLQISASPQAIPITFQSRGRADLAGDQLLP